MVPFGSLEVSISVLNITGFPTVAAILNLPCVRVFGNLGKECAWPLSEETEAERSELIFTDITLRICFQMFHWFTYMTLTTTLEVNIIPHTADGED